MIRPETKNTNVIWVDECPKLSHYLNNDIFVMFHYTKHWMYSADCCKLILEIFIVCYGKMDWTKSLVLLFWLGISASVLLYNQFILLLLLQVFSF